MIRLNEKRMVEFVPRDISGHQTHFEDLVLLGSNGLEELNDKIEKFLSNSKENKKLNKPQKGKVIDPMDNLLIKELAASCLVELGINFSFNLVKASMLFISGIPESIIR